MQIEKQKRQGARIPRCRMYLRSELGWLPGFPLSQGDGRVGWMPAPQLGVESAEPLELDSERVRRGASAWTTLVRDFPRALPRVVGELDRWRAGVPRLLGWLTDALQRGERLPLLAVDQAIPAEAAARAERLAGRIPALGPLMTAATWSSFLAPAGLPRVLAWTEANAGAVEGILAVRPGAAGIVDVLTLSALANEDESSIARLLRIVGAPRARRSTRGAKVLKFAVWIGGQAPPVSRRALRLLGLVLHNGLLKTPRADLDGAFGSFKASVATESAGFYRDLLRLLERLPRANNARFRCWFLALWCEWRARDSGPVVRLVRELYGYLSSQPGSTPIDSWLNEAPEDPRWLHVVGRTDGGRLRGRWHTLFDAVSQVGALQCKEPITCADGPLIVDLVLALGDARDACRRFRQLDEAGYRDKGIDIEVLRLAFELDTGATRLAALVTVRNLQEVIIS